MLKKKQLLIISSYHFISSFHKLLSSYLKKDKIIRYVILPLVVFLWTYLLRMYFFCGFILGDDIEEFWLVKNIAEHGPNFQGHLQYRFGLWCFNVIAFKILGISESSFFFSTWFMSSSFGVIGYFILVRGQGTKDIRQLAVGSWQETKKPDPRSPISDPHPTLKTQHPTFDIRNSPFYAFLAALFIASAPFETLIGTVRANDLILSWLLALGFLFFIIFEEMPIRQGILLAFFLWFAFYTKLWAVYLLPGLGVFYLIQLVRNRRWHGLVSFACTSLFLHGIACVYWKIKIGVLLPFITKYSATYPVASKDLIRTFLFYPEMVLQGSEFGTTLFGIIPYLLFIALFAKIIMPFDRLDIYLLVYYGSFFLLLNFFPNSFQFDQYYSAPRIFRYLAPISFPMTLHLAKLLLEFSVSFRAFCPVRDKIFNNLTNLKYQVSNGIRRPGNNTIGIRGYICPIIFTLLIITNIYYTDNATKSGQIYRKALVSILKDVKEKSPPVILVEAWLSYFMRHLYLKPDSDKISVPPILHIHNARDYEKWLRENQDSLPEGTMMISGLGSYLHYGCHPCGFRLARFEDKIDPRWKLFKEYGMLSYLPIPEPARLWRLSGPTDASLPSQEYISEKSNPDDLFKKGIDYFDQSNYIKAKAYCRIILHDFPDATIADDALYFYAICFFREGNWKVTITEFKRLIHDYPESSWIAGAHYHIGLSYRELNEIEKARKEFRYVTNHFAYDENLVNLSKERLEELR